MRLSAHLETRGSVPDWVLRSALCATVAAFSLACSAAPPTLSQEHDAPRACPEPDVDYTPPRFCANFFPTEAGCQTSRWRSDVIDPALGWDQWRGYGDCVGSIRAQHPERPVARIKQWCAWEAGQEAVVGTYWGHENLELLPGSWTVYRATYWERGALPFSVTASATPHGKSLVITTSPATDHGGRLTRRLDEREWQTIEAAAARLTTRPAASRLWSMDYACLDRPEVGAHVEVWREGTRRLTDPRPELKSCGLDPPGTVDFVRLLGRLAGCSTEGDASR
ncbi:MAG TPA: hypothetical protein VLC09_04010 [Polyangiaceae bacterium]|nr:hypothetical protein [Polyangiaceae bacterium]